MDNIIVLGLPIVEWIGYTASLIVLISLSLSSLVNLRIYNLIGAAIFSFYGFYIGALPVGIMNMAICLFNIYYLRLLLFKKEKFDFFETHDNDPLLLNFLKYYKRDISKFIPEFELQPTKDTFILIALRDMNVAGIFIGTKPNNGTSEVILDYVTPEYRDNKTGKFLFKNFKDGCLQKNIHQLTCSSSTPGHIKYLNRNGFSKDANNNYILTFK